MTYYIKLVKKLIYSLSLFGIPITLSSVCRGTIRSWKPLSDSG